MAGDSDGKMHWVGWMALGFLGLLSLACIGIGGVFYVWIIADWSQGSGAFTGIQMLGWIVGLIAAAVIGLGLILAGLLLRFMRWTHAPLASLLLSIASVGFILATYSVFSDTGNDSDSIEIVLLQGLCIVCLFVIPLPPFLHWLFARGKAPTAAAAAVTSDAPKV